MAIGDENRGVLRQADWGAADVSLVANQWTRYGYHKVLPGFAVALGFGHTKGQANAEGRAYGDTVTVAPLEIEGRIRFMLHSAADSPLRKLWEGDIQSLHDAAVADRSTMMPFPEIPHFATRDQLIVCEMKVDTAALTNVATCVLTVDTTVLEVPA